MEHMGAISEGESSSQNAEFMAFPLYNTVPSIFWPCHGSTMDMAGLVEDSYHSSDLSSSILYSPSHSSRNSLTQKGYYMSHDSSMSMDFCMADVKKSSLFLTEGDGYLNLEMSGEDAEECASFLDPMSEDNNPPEKPKKRSRTSEDVKKNIRVQQAMMNQKLASTSKNEEDNNGELNGQSSSSCSSEDDSNVCQKQNGVTLSLITKGPADSNPSGKTKAKRGSTTDLQSLHARKRRERINARLKTLQNLIPNGTKVDISTMLEDAVHYVKFLHLQIKLLCSDNLWMYAPIAYNGLDIGLDPKISHWQNGIRLKDEIAFHRV